MFGLSSVVLLLYFMPIVFSADNDALQSVGPSEDLTAASYVFWPNATVPFYIHSTEFDPDQLTTIMRALSIFADKTCIQFLPLLVPPNEDDHVMSFVNPKGIRKCVFNTDGHSPDGNHQIVMGYDCLKTETKVQMMIMKALGFGFEHNRPVRDMFIEIQPENIEPGSLELFTKDNRIPVELHPLPYDINSVMHFGQRDYSKNGHKTIRYKSGKLLQHQEGLSAMDIRKIQIVYGPECLKRERQEKKELCQSYPGAARRKRSAEAEVSSPPSTPIVTMETEINLRVNRDITPGLNDISDVQGTVDVVNELDLNSEIEEMVDKVFKLNAVALEKARLKYCNNSQTFVKKDFNIPDDLQKGGGVSSVILAVASYTKSVVEKAVQNLTQFCEEPLSPEMYQRAGCSFFSGKEKCTTKSKSTKVGLVKHATQHRPWMPQSTKHVGNPVKYNFMPLVRAGGDVAGSRRKRSDDGVTPSLRRFEKLRMNRKSKDTDSMDSDESDGKQQVSKSKEKPQENTDEKDYSASEDEIRELPNKVSLTKANADFYRERKWLGGTVRYFIEPLEGYNLEDLRRRLAEVNEILSESTCVRIVEIHSPDLKRYEDYLILDDSPDYVTGRVGGAQKFGAIELFHGGQHRQHTAMMVMAMFGFYFEISRHDRDKYVRVHFRHIRADKLHHFDKLRKDATLDLPYDYKSATHPPWQFWRKFGKTGIASVATLKTRDPDGSIMKLLGKNEPILSEIDIIKINSVYGNKCFYKKKDKKQKKEEKEEPDK